MSKKIKIFTDGSCLGNPGPGGYCSLLYYSKYEITFNAGYKLTTNNRMELMATIIPLESLKYSCTVTIITDSKYVHIGITKWIYNWKKHCWKNNKKNKIKNIDLWKRLDKLSQLHTLYWNWIKSHMGCPKNEYCDKLAKKSAILPIYEDIKYQK